jgi:putative peptide maturation system protein
MILIVSTAADDHVASVVPLLRKRGASVLWLDLAELPARAALAVTIEPRRDTRPMLHVRGTDVDLRAVTAAWIRHPQHPAPDDTVESPLFRDYARQETADAWAGVTAMLDCLWLPGPRWQEERAGHKPLQLHMATAVGFEIPPTLVTNDPEAFLAFRRRHPGKLISKTVHNRLLPPDARNGYAAYALTEVVANRDVGHLMAIRHCPVTFQSYVDKQVELRVTVVGRRVFAVALDSQWTNRTRYDWRRGDHHHARYAVHRLPAAVARRCVAIVERLGLCFGAIDLVLTPDGRYVFLEVNPNGEWLWTERTTELPIGAAIADLLCSHEPGTRSTSVPADLLPDATPKRPPAADPPPASPERQGARSTLRCPPAVDAAITAGVRFLDRIVTSKMHPDEALRRFRPLARRHPGVAMDLVWDIEHLEGAIHYDVVLRAPRGPTISIAVSPSDGVPWAFRHAHHARESDLLRVNGRTLNVQTVMGYLDGLWHDARLVSSLVDGCLVLEAVETLGITASDAEVRRATETFLRARGLTAQRALAPWLRARGWNEEDLAHEVRRQVVARKLRTRIAAGRGRDYFTQHRATLDTAVLARLRLSDPDVARRIAAAARSGTSGVGQAFEDVAATHEDFDGHLEIATVRRRDLTLPQGRAIFAAAPAAVLGPFASRDGHDVIQVLRSVPARFDRPTRTLVDDLLFDEWLAARRREASVEWFWGDAERAPARARAATGVR